ncbi:ATP phosphoribosyltransferase regulatory subunit [Faunimonas pinastri]|uniref:ATP phosphoribosyltransferase regulatory subunit n=1 Tax=Faunimonas pinastri TaxID=1855383 RepID=A0A1H8ZIU9_9HYPH|nr:ATP phosphoribosyltransferase regulatory subunit [Faunimonas pinastri]SEP64352.1 ATP phosphoribosyltransferase regulatory subunit [Faunimonas pinastri]
MPASGADFGVGEGRLKALFDAVGAEWLDLPVLHPADPFLETAGEDIRRRMFVTEGPTGERLALRPDFTIPVCLHHLAHAAAPRCYAYEGVVFRRHDTGSPERLETGYEDIGRASAPEVDAEILKLAVSGVSSLGAGDINVQVGDIALFTALLQALEIPPAWQRRLRRAFGLPARMAAHLARLSSPREGRPALDAELRKAAEAGDRDALTGALQARLAAQGYLDPGRSATEIAERYLDQQALTETRLSPRVIEALRAFLSLEAEVDRAADELNRFAQGAGVDLGPALEALAATAEAIGTGSPGVRIRFAAGFGRPLDYYTGLVFDVRAQNYPYPLAGGGRYDRLMQVLGAPASIPAIGFTIRLDEPSPVGAQAAGAGENA